MSKGHFKLHEQIPLIGHDSPDLDGRVTISSTGKLSIQVDNHECCTSNSDREGALVTVELIQGHVQVHVWADVNQEDPTHIIDLELARRIHRRPASGLGSRRTKCQECASTYLLAQIQPMATVKGLRKLLPDPGEEMPAGVCPKCSGLCFLQES